MENKKRNLSNPEKIPKLCYGLARSMIGEQPKPQAPATISSTSTQSTQQSNKNNKGQKDEGGKRRREESRGSGNKEDKRKKIAKSSSGKGENREELTTPQSEMIETSQPGLPPLQSPEGREEVAIDETSAESIQYPVNTSQVGALLFTSQSKVIHISGFCTLKLLSGKGNINGYRLRAGEAVSIRSPPWIPAIRLFFEVTTATEELSKKRFVNELIQSRPYLGSCQQEMTKRLNSSMGIVEVISADMTTENWMIRCEDFSKYQLPVPLLSTAVLFLSTAVIGNSKELTQLGLDSHHLPTDWVIAGDLVCKSMKISPKSVLLGAKGVGKSTTLRYLINRILSKSPFVAVLDCDVGQPEFTPSGLLSLHILTKQDLQSTSRCVPLLSPPHLHLHKPQLSFYLGDVSMRNHPEIFEHCLLSLYSKYLLYAEYYQTTGRLPLDSEDEITEENLREFSHTSNFHLLSQDSDETQFPLPLVVNTDGMIRGIGVEIQRIILQTVKPTHILHLQNEKDKILAPIEEMREQFEEKGDKKEEGNQNVKQKLHICILTPGRNTASRLSAQNLRDLRMVSYFLSKSSYLDQITAPPSSSPIVIRSGVCLDSLGHLPTALVNLFEDSHPISKICFHLIGSNIPPRLILAAFNVAVVGISLTTPPSSSSSTSIASIGYRTCHLQIPPEVIPLITSSPHESSRTSISYQLNYAMNETSIHLLPCKGLGVVSDFDLLHSIAHLITPEDIQIDCLSSSSYPFSSSGPSLSVLHLSRGSIQLPTLLIYNSSGQVCTPYLCSENFGEGSATLSARTNMKRRSHGK